MNKVCGAAISNIDSESWNDTKSPTLQVQRFYWTYHSNLKDGEEVQCDTAYLHASGQMSPS